MYKQFEGKTENELLLLHSSIETCCRLILSFLERSSTGTIVHDYQNSDFLHSYCRPMLRDSDNKKTSAILMLYDRLKNSERALPPNIDFI